MEKDKKTWYNYVSTVNVSPCLFKFNLGGL